MRRGGEGNGGGDSGPGGELYQVDDAFLPIPSMLIFVTNY